MRNNISQEKLPLDYFLLVVLLSIPFWLLGGSKLPLPINLPVSAISTFVPMLAAAILSYWRSGPNGARELLMRIVDFKKIKNKLWYLPALLLAPLIYVSSYVTMRLTGLPLPDPIYIPPLMVPVFFVMFFIADAGEELGWTGYAIDPMQKRWGAVKASFILGLLWAIYHSVTFVQSGYKASWIIWQCIKTVAMRMVIVWIYNKSGKSVFAANLYHTTDNLCWSLFPNYGSHYSPFVTGLLTCLTVVIVIFGWGNKRLSLNRRAGVGGS